jgi:hypothetical protein
MKTNIFKINEMALNILLDDFFEIIEAAEEEEYRGCYYCRLNCSPLCPHPSKRNTENCKRALKLHLQRLAVRDLTQ